MAAEAKGEVVVMWLVVVGRKESQVAAGEAAKNLRYTYSILVTLSFLD